jgi:hypothetical protein
MRSDRQPQIDSYLACESLAEAVARLSDSFVPSHLVEQLHAMLEHRVTIGYYPHLSFATGPAVRS